MYWNIFKLSVKHSRSRPVHQVLQANIRMLQIRNQVREGALAVAGHVGGVGHRCRCVAKDMKRPRREQARRTPHEIGVEKAPPHEQDIRARRRVRIGMRLIEQVFLQNRGCCKNAAADARTAAPRAAEGELIMSNCETIRSSWEGSSGWCRIMRMSSETR